MFTAMEVVKVIGGRLPTREGTLFASVNTDSRKIREGSLFIPLQGENFDGHDFIKQVIEKGAAGVLISEDRANIYEHFKKQSPDCCLILVKDCLKALQTLARYHRNLINPKVVAITGSNGKTTTKEMIWSILKLRYNTLKNEGNLNNYIGLPLTLLELKPGHEVAVIEFGINFQGEMERLCRIAQPDIAVITNIGTAHLEGLGSIEGVAVEKGRMLDYAEKAVLNADDERCSAMSGRIAHKLLYGINSDKADVKGEICGDRSLTIYTGSEKINVKVKSIASHDYYNALAAAGAALMMNMPLYDIKRGLEEYIPASMRMQRHYLKEDILLINDCYNANPASVNSAVDTLSSLSGKGKKIAILGDMMELGEYEKELHLEVGAHAAHSGIDLLAAVGSRAAFIAERAEEAGMKRENIRLYENASQAAKDADKYIGAGDIILVKGSRKMKMEQIADEIIRLFGVNSSLG